MCLSVSGSQITVNLFKPAFLQSSHLLKLILIADVITFCYLTGESKHQDLSLITCFYCRLWDQEVQKASKEMRMPQLSRVIIRCYWKSYGVLGIFTFIEVRFIIIKIMI